MTEAASLTSDCAIHDKAEPVTEHTYRVCFECGHVYERPADLVKEYERIVKQMNDDLKSQEKRLYPWTKPADEIYFCQLCLHDF